MRRVLGLVLLLLLMPLQAGALIDELERQAGLADIALDLPTLPPEPWSYRLPGWERPGSPDPRPDVGPELQQAITQLQRPWPTDGHGDDLLVCCPTVLHLRPPGAPPRAILWLSDYNLWLVEQRGKGWHTEQLTTPHVRSVMVRDLTGDGRPEVIAAWQSGSGAVLFLQILTWDETGVWTAFEHHGASEPGQFGFFDAEGDGVSELWIDSASTKALFTAEPHAHTPFLRDRFIYRWKNGTYRQSARYRYATPFYHLNRYLWFASRGEWEKAARHLEPGARIDPKLVAHLGTGPFREGGDSAFVNGRFFFAKGEERYYADFGPTGRLLRIGEAEAAVPSTVPAAPPGWAGEFSAVGRSAHWKAESLFSGAADDPGFEFDTTLTWLGKPARLKWYRVEHLFPEGVTLRARPGPPMARGACTLDIDFVAEAGEPTRTGQGFTHGRCTVYPWSRPMAELVQAVSQALYLVTWEDENGIHAEALDMEPLPSSLRQH